MELLTPYFDVWYILGVIAILGLVSLFNKSRYASWGGLAAGVVLGFIIALVFMIRGDGFIWAIVPKTAIIGTLIGITVEFIHRFRKD